MLVGDETSSAAADITVSDVRVTESVTDFGYTEQAANGYFVTFHVEITSTGQEGYTFNPFNYVVISEGQQYQYGDGNSMMVGEVGEQLSSGTLAPGARTEGDITFDVGSPPGELSYTPNYDGCRSAPGSSDRAYGLRTTVWTGRSYRPTCNGQDV